MKFATFKADGQVQYGVIADEGAISLSAEFPEWPTLRDVIQAGGLGSLAGEVRGRCATHRHGAFTFEIPVPDAEKIICVGVNFPGRSAEYRDQRDEVSKMSLFPRFSPILHGPLPADNSAAGIRQARLRGRDRRRDR